MCFSMTGGTQRDQVLLDVVAQLTAKLLVMNLKIAQTAARLTSPAISLQDFATELFVGLAGKPQPRMFWPDCIHEALCRDKNACFCSPGRNLKNREMDCSSSSGSPLYRLAPARKSAQIISRQYPRDLSVPNIRAAVSMACSMIGIWLL